MKSVAGIFTSRDAAESAVQRLASAGIPQDHLTLLTPGSDTRRLASMPVDEGEAPGTGAAIGAVTGVATGAGVGLPIGAAVGLIVPGIGPILAFGLLGAALFGAGGAAIGTALENRLSQGVPRDDLFVYEDALREGQSVVVALVDDEVVAMRARELLREAGGWISRPRGTAGGAAFPRPSAGASTPSRNTRIAAASRPRSGATTARTCGRCTARSSMTRRSGAASSAVATIGRRGHFARPRDDRAGRRRLTAPLQTPGRSSRRPGSLSP